MAIEHAAPGDLIDVRPLGRRLRETDSRTLIRTTHLEVFRYALPAGKSIAPHSVAGEITIQCIEGQIDVTVDGQSRLLQSGQMLFLSRCVSYGVLAVQDASALMTIVVAK